MFSCLWLSLLYFWEKWDSEIFVQRISCLLLIRKWKAKSIIISRHLPAFRKLLIILTRNDFFEMCIWIKLNYYYRVASDLYLKKNTIERINYCVKKGRLNNNSQNHDKILNKLHYKYEFVNTINDLKFCSSNINSRKSKIVPFID